MSFDWLEKCAVNDYSQFGEDGILHTIFSVITPANKWCFECGAADGLFFSNTRRLIEKGWNAILVEADPSAFARLETNNESFGERVRCLHQRIGAELRLEAILKHCGAPFDIDLMVIDVDGQDYYLFNSLVLYRPRVVVIEFDHLADEEFIPSLGGEGQAGKKAILRLLMGKFYIPIFCGPCNVIAVKRPLDRLLQDSAVHPK